MGGKMTKKTDRIVYKNADGDWANKKLQNEKATSLHKTQKAAENTARIQIKKEGGGELITKGRDGKIRSKDTIAPGNDPKSIKDSEN